MMHIIGWIIFGLIVGLIARALMPGPQPMGLTLTIILGVLGSFVGGALANLFQGGNFLEPRATSWIGSILGAIVLLLVYGLATKPRA